MKSILTILILASFIGIAVFGFVGMTSAQHLHGGCIASLADKGLCPSGVVPVSAAFSHLEVLKSFSLAFLTGFASLVSLIALAFAVSGRNPDIPEAVFRPVSALGDLFKDSNNSLAHNFEWLAIHFNSPSFVLSA